MRMLGLQDYLCLTSSPNAQAEQAHLTHLISHDGFIRRISARADGLCKGPVTGASAECQGLTSHQAHAHFFWPGIRFCLGALRMRTLAGVMSGSDFSPS